MQAFIPKGAEITNIVEIAGKNSKDKLTKEELMSITPEELQELIDKGEIIELTQEEYEAELRRQNRKH